MHRRTRIVATLGPATDPPDVLKKLIDAGLDVARINLSHGSPAEHQGRIRRLVAAADAAKRAVAVLADLPGPKLRVKLPEPLDLAAGEALVLTTDPREPNEASVTEPECLSDARPGHRLLLDDGRLQLRVESVSEGRLVARVEIGGRLLPNKGINLPDSPLSIPAVTDRDREALAAIAGERVDWLALSFVRGPEAAAELRAVAKPLGLDLPVIAKVERPEAVTRAAEIVEAFDGIMVARGDLGVEIPLEEVPGVQKTLIAIARQHGKPVITATDMLDSMRTNPRPTRAEASDVANAIYDGTDAVMLSGETAVGQYPVEAVTCMARIAEQVERATAGPTIPPPDTHSSQDDHISLAVCKLAATLKADAIVVPTLSGRTARLVARYRPAARLIAPVPSEAVRRQLALCWGAVPVVMGKLPRNTDRIEAAVRAAHDKGVLATGEKVVALAGHPLEGGERLPTLRFAGVGDEGYSVEP